MALLFSSSCNQSTTPVIFINSMADDGNGADYDGRNSADADREDANNNEEEYQHTNRENGAVSPANSNPGNDVSMS